MTEQPHPKDWDRKSEWRKMGNGFQVQVSRHERGLSEIFSDEGPHRWSVYAYIYPKHPMFGRFIPYGKTWQEAATSLPLHAYPSFFKAHRANDEDREEITAFQVGSDYNHLHDERFTYMDDDNFPEEVAFDAQALFDFLARDGENK